MNFELKVGMKDSEIYDLIKGKVSGEGSDQIQQFYYPKNIDSKDKPVGLHNVLMANQEYAVIQKKQSIFEEEKLYLSGISDEDTYFVHEIPQKLKEEQLDEIIKTVNREDIGYERIQGDVLIKFVKVTDFKDLERGIPEYYGFWSKKLNPNSLFPRKFTLNGEKFQPAWGETIFSSHEVRIGTGKLYHYHDWDHREDEKYLILGDTVILNHNEHTQKEIKIPRERGLLIQAQVGNSKYYD